MAMVTMPVEPALTEYLFRKAAKMRIPLSASLELTPVCNMACKMCYIRMTREEQEKIRPLHTAEEWIELGRKMKEAGVLYILLTGGEPFLRPDFQQILAALHEMGFIISINSNGTLIDEKVMEWLVKTPPSRINMTLYGASDETYDRLCGNPKGFTQVVRAIRLLKEAGITVKLNCSVTPDNVADLDRMMDFAEQEQLIIQPTSYMFPPMRKDASMVGRNERFTPEDAAYISARIEARLNGEDRFLERMKNREFPPLPSDLDDCEDVQGDGIRCRAGKCSLWITWDGTLLPCGMMPASECLNVFDKGLDQAWEVAVRKSAAIRLPGKCAKCESAQECRSCAAMVYTESGSFSRVPEYRCRMTKAYRESCMQVAREIQDRLDKEEDINHGQE